MAKVKVTAKFQILELIDNFVDNTTANSIGQTVVDEAKDNIASGLSPVRGIGRYIRYSDSYSNWIKSKSNREGKKVRPVNLNLTGEMLEGYGYEVGPDGKVLVGMVKGSAFAKEKAGYHQTGTGKMPARPLVPGPNEEWSVSIMRKIRDVYGTRLEKLIRQGNKKA